MTFQLPEMKSLINIYIKKYTISVVEGSCWIMKNQENNENMRTHQDIGP